MQRDGHAQLIDALMLILRKYYQTLKQFQILPGSRGKVSAF
jgi:hypothetical protein